MTYKISYTVCSQAQVTDPGVRSLGHTFLQLIFFILQFISPAIVIMNLPSMIIDVDSIARIFFG